MMDVPKHQWWNHHPGMKKSLSIEKKNRRSNIAVGVRTSQVSNCFTEDFGVLVQISQTKSQVLSLPTPPRGFCPFFSHVLMTFNDN
jgi:hypothetical protein